MDDFQKQLAIEMATQQRNLKACQKVLEEAPDGFLLTRQRKNKTTYYQQQRVWTSSGSKIIQTNINNNPEIIEALTKKAVAEEMVRTYRNNIPLLSRLEARYASVGKEDVYSRLPEKYDEAIIRLQEAELKKEFAKPYNKCPYFPRALNMETAYGGFVRSKSEAIIANALYAFGIPFHYEEKLMFSSDESPFYPDFTIFLPEYKRLYWEHFGLLGSEEYCEKNGEKLFAYQKNNLVIGKNLILSQDDRDGNCSSAYIYDIIEKSLLPLYGDIKVDRDLIRRCNV